MKRGDKVIYIGTILDAPFTTGKKYTICSLDGTLIELINDLGMRYWWYAHTFKLVNEHKLSYKRISRRKHG